MLHITMLVKSTLDHLGSISSTLLHVQIPKAKKKKVKLSGFFALLGSVSRKAANKEVGEMDP
jgi:hypothetical protein